MMARNLLIFLLVGGSVFGQTKREREYRIDLEEFPSSSYKILQPYLEDAKRIRFYKEEDGEKQSFEAKFKKGRLKYSVEFDSTGQLEDVEFIIKENDFPSDVLRSVEAYLSNEFKKHRIKKMQQQYFNDSQGPAKTLRNAFQNLLIPELRYELIVNGRGKGPWRSFELLFDSEGNHISTRTIVTPKYDHVLY